MIKAQNTYDYNHFIRFIYLGKHVMVINGRTGVWIKILKEVKDFIDKSIEAKLTLEETINKTEDIPTRNYVEELLEEMFSHSMLKDCKSDENDKLKLDSVSFSLTNKCNLRCIHCANNSGEYIKNELDFKQVCKIIDYISNLEIKELCLTGGEIFVREDIDKILEYASEKFSGSLEIMSNGTLINNKEIARLIFKTCDKVHLSLDGFDKDSVDKIRGPGIYEKVLKSITLLKDAGIDKITLSMVKTKINDDIKFKELCEKLGVKPVIRKLDPVGRGKECYDELKLSSQNNEDVKMMRKNVRGNCFCKAGVTTIFIDEIGDVYPCDVLNFPEYRVGNFFHDNFSDNFQSDLRKIIEKLNICILDQIEDCKECNYRYFCSNGCPGIDRLIFNNENYKKEICHYNKEKFKNLI
ncbi:radical SAM/SPASM domain-containing protein [Dethiothermospora halolimnae]|uniref:radical SAM/SPASM domain-containing protein n=1 Tax=Dethiothermospora halolimnae TaxID=3114390 RepID=UPI003CCB7F94